MVGVAAAAACLVMPRFELTGTPLRVRLSEGLDPTRSHAFHGSNSGVDCLWVKREWDVTNSRQ